MNGESKIFFYSFDKLWINMFTNAVHNINYELSIVDNSNIVLMAE